MSGAEQRRLLEAGDRSRNWRRWGPYLADRQWGVVREDYSADGDVWRYFPHEQARSRAYRWGEDGLLGLCDRKGRLCFAPAFWNQRDPILKERLFGLTGPEGNHGEDVKELYYFEDATPTYSYARARYLYPQAEFPYARLVDENRRRGRQAPEFELLDTGLFDGNRFFDITVEYAKAGPEDVLIRIRATNRGPEPAMLHALPTLWYRNTWSWGCVHEGCEIKPSLRALEPGLVRGEQATLGSYFWRVAPADDGRPAPLLFTENETNALRLFGAGDGPPGRKDAFHDRVILGDESALNPNPRGTKAAAWYVWKLAPGETRELRSRLASAREPLPADPLGADFNALFDQRQREADAFYAEHQPPELPPERRAVARQAYAGLLWSKQFYHYGVREWLDGDPDQPTPPAGRRAIRNGDWGHVFCRDVISMPDKWEYPWFAAWDLAFHMLPFARIDPEFAKDQLLLFLREWYLHPNGQLPAYEFNFSDVNPPVHAWACWRVYKMAAGRGHRDTLFLRRAFQKLLINFTWWVNRKDATGRHLFSGGFLGLDNIGVFDRSKPLPTGGRLEQADGTAWMAFYCSTMLSMALELAADDEAYEDVASKFFEHFIAIVEAMNHLGGTGLWDESDGFYYDYLAVDGAWRPLRIRSMVGVVPLFAVEVLDDERLRKLPNFTRRMEWFLQHRPELASLMALCTRSGGRPRRLLAIPSRERLERVLQRLFDTEEFLSPYGLRALSRHHRAHPFVFEAQGQQHRVEYLPGESDSGFFGGNSNWRGPVWMPMNYLLIEALERYHHFYGDDMQLEYPRGSGMKRTLLEIARDLEDRLCRIFLPDEHGRRPVHGSETRYATDAPFKDNVLFYEYFHGDDGRGLGASHQTGWTALVALLLEDARRCRPPTASNP